MIENRFGETKLPGGVNYGEDDYQTLIREVKEETGYDVIPETIRPFGEIKKNVCLFMNQSFGIKLIVFIFVK